jgi:hypothetical protein
MASLAEILEALEVKLGPDCRFRDGPEHLIDGSPPRIVAVPTEEAVGAPSETWRDGPRAVAQRDVTVVFHVWAKTRAGTEELLRLLLVAVRGLAGAAAQLSAGGWKLQDAQALTKNGRGYELTIVFGIPVLEGPAATATIAGSDSSDVAFDPHPVP